MEHTLSWLLRAELTSLGHTASGVMAFVRGGLETECVREENIKFSNIGLCISQILRDSIGLKISA